MNNRGMVLITVLWVVIVISFISLSLAAAVRVEMRAIEDSFDSERAFFMAKSAAEVVFRDLQKPDSLKGSPVLKEGGSYVVPFSSGEARVHLESNGGLININGASDRVLESMFASLGVDEPLRGQLVDSIIDWRDPDDVPLPQGAEIADYGQVIRTGKRLPSNDSFASLDELMLVRNMTPQVFFGHIEVDEGDRSYRRIRGLRELITLGPERNHVNVNEASEDVLKALPGMTSESVARIILERMRKSFDNEQDLVTRVPALQYSESIEHLSTVSVLTTGIVSVASVRPSGASRKPAARPACGPLSSTGRQNGRPQSCGHARPSAKTSPAGCPARAHHAPRAEDGRSHTFPSGLRS